MSELRAACHGRTPERDGWPTVSVVVPVRDEAAHLEQAVASILAQDYPLPFDVCLAVAPSHDGTERIADAISAADRRVSVIHNPTGGTPSGLNAAIRATNGSIVVRVDAHAQLSPGYLRRAVETMCRTGAVNVGGRQLPRPETRFEEAVASATTSWMGTGGASYRVGGAPASVDTVYLGVFDRAAGDAVGWFDESLIRNQDYELNIRLRGAGGTVWFDPELWVGYRPRGTWRALAKQYFEYGWWKAEVLRRHPDSVRPRQLLPVVNTVTQSFALVIARRRRVALLAPVGYITLLIGSSLARPASTVRTVIVTVTMHHAWTAGLLVGLARGRRNRYWWARATR